jgi:hypothetical protein
MGSGALALLASRAKARRYVERGAYPPIHTKRKGGHLAALLFLDNKSNLVRER